MLYLSADEAKLFLDKARSDKWYSAFLLALETGMRPEEYLGLKWSDIDFDRGFVTVRRALVWLKGGGWKFEEPKTSQSRRTISVTSSALAALKRHKVDQAEHILKLGADYQKHDLVFASGTGTPLLWRNLRNRHFKKILENDGLPKAETLRSAPHVRNTIVERWREPEDCF